MSADDHMSEAEYEYQYAICQEAGDETPETWKTKDGKEIPICELGDGHLRNIVFMMWRQHEMAVLKYCLQVGPMGEMAADAFAEECAYLGDSNPERTTKFYAPMIDECARRGWDVAKLEREAVRAIYAERKQAK